MLLCEEVVALCCSAACDGMTSLIVNVTYVGNALTSNDVPRCSVNSICRTAFSTNQCVRVRSNAECQIFIQGDRIAKNSRGITLQRIRKVTRCKVMLL
jgi:hypothetical protein